MANTDGIQTEALPTTLEFDGIAERSLDETLVSRDADGGGGATRAEVRALPQLLGHGAGGEAEFTSLEAIAVGGIGLIERARQRSLARDVVIKRVRDPSMTSATSMLLEEGRVMSQLHHPGIVPLIAVGRDGDGQPVIIMERIEGTTWRTLLHDPTHAAWRDHPGDRLTFHLRVLARVADVAHFAHEHGWLHRDIKPENVMVGPGGDVYLIDWGLAVQIPATHDGRNRSLVGTPGYMAPEMLQGAGSWLSPRTDVYLLGATLHEVLTGRVRHEGRTLRAVLSSAWLSEEYPYTASTPAELASLATDATRPRSEARPPSADAFKRRLEAYLSRRAALGAIAAGRARLEQTRARAPDDDGLRGRVSDLVQSLRRGLTGAPAWLRAGLAPT